jgi:hypothetical protein
MKYYSYTIDYDPKNGSFGVIAIPTKKKLNSREVLKVLQDAGEVEPFEPRDFSCVAISKEEYDEEVKFENS